MKKKKKVKHFEHNTTFNIPFKYNGDTQEEEKIERKGSILQYLYQQIKSAILWIIEPFIDLIKPTLQISASIFFLGSILFWGYTLLSDPIFSLFEMKEEFSKTSEDKNDFLSERKETSIIKLNEQLIKLNSLKSKSLYKEELAYRLYELNSDSVSLLKQKQKQNRKFRSQLLIEVEKQLIRDVKKLNLNYEQVELFALKTTYFIKKYIVSGKLSSSQDFEDFFKFDYISEIQEDQFNPRKYLPSLTNNYYKLGINDRKKFKEEVSEMISIFISIKFNCSDKYTTLLRVSDLLFDLVFPPDVEVRHTIYETDFVNLAEIFLSEESLNRIKEVKILKDGIKLQGITDCKFYNIPIILINGFQRKNIPLDLMGKLEIKDHNFKFLIDFVNINHTEVIIDNQFPVNFFKPLYPILKLKRSIGRYYTKVVTSRIKSIQYFDGYIQIKVAWKGFDERFKKIVSVNNDYTAKISPFEKDEVAFHAKKNGLYVFLNSFEEWGLIKESNTNKLGWIPLKFISEIVTPENKIKVNKK